MTSRIAEGLIAFLAGSLVCVGGVSAQISPSPHVFSMGGPVVFSQVGGGSLSCTMNMNIVVHGGGMTGSVTSASFTGGPLCSAIIPSALPWNVARITPTSMYRIRISNMKFVMVAGYCDNGAMIFLWDMVSPIGYTDGVMPGAGSLSYPAASCNIDGNLSVTSGGPVSVR